MALPSTGWGEEGGAGHYVPGAMADFVDMLPGQPGWAYANFPLYYHGSVGAGRTLEFGGVVTANASATIWGTTSLLLYETPWRILGGEYATGIAIPYLSMDVQGTVGIGPARQTDDIVGERRWPTEVTPMLIRSSA